MNSKFYDQYMYDKMYKKFIMQYPVTFDKVRTLLNGDDFEEFSMACNYIVHPLYDDMDFIARYNNLRELHDITNQRVRELLGVDVSALFDMVVKKSKQELWCGDELYKLFSYDLPPYYVRKCIKSVVYVTSMSMEHMTVGDCLKVADYIYNPPYWDIYRDDFSEPDFERNKIRKKECLAWRKIAEFLFHGNIMEAHEFLKENDEYRKYYE